MNKFRYGRGNKHFFTILTPLSKNVSNIIAKLHYENFLGVSYKDFTKLCVSCDKGPEVCEGELLPAINVTTGERTLFRVKKINHNDEVDIWTVELEREVPGNEPIPNNI